MTSPVGLSVTLRLRMGAHDAHYAGELVDGARVLALFGDVATELLIRLDGDEGLFRAYEEVEFLAPLLISERRIWPSHISPDIQRPHATTRHVGIRDGSRA